MEINALAIYFRITIHWQKDGGSEEMGVGKGFIESLDENKLNVLQELNIGVRYLSGFRISSAFRSKAQLPERFKLLSYANEIISYLCNDLKNRNFPSRIDGIPDNELSSLKEQLFARGILITRNNEVLFIGKEEKEVDLERIILKVSGATHQLLINKVLSHFIEKPAGFSVIHQGLHWSYSPWVLGESITDAKPDRIMPTSTTTTTSIITHMFRQKNAAGINEEESPRKKVRTKTTYPKVVFLKPTQPAPRHKKKKEAPTKQLN